MYKLEAATILMFFSIIALSLFIFWMNPNDEINGMMYRPLFYIQVLTLVALFMFFNKMGVI